MLYRSFIVLSCLVLLSACVESQDPASRVVDRQQAVDDFVSLGMAYLQRGNRDASRRNFEKAFDLQPNAKAAHNGIGLLYQLNGETALAEASFQRAIKTDAKYSQARVNYGAFLYQQERYQEAFDQFKLASEDLEYNNRPLSLAYLGRAALRLGDKIRAKSAFEHSLNLDSSLALSQIELAEIHFDDKEYPEAKKYLDQYIADQKSSARSLWLGIRIERIFGNKDKEASYVLALKNLHPYSNEYLAYKNLIEQSS